MGLSNDLISQFVKATKDTPKKSKETTAYGTVKIGPDNIEYVQLDGSNVLTPVSSTVSVKNGDRVIVMIKNHTATITGNLADNAARLSLVTNEDGEPIKLDVERLVADHATINGYLFANSAEIDSLEARDVSIYGILTAAEANIDTLSANVLNVEIANVKYATITEALTATNAEIFNLASVYGEFHTLATDKFTAYDATINSLDTTYANIDFANIDEAAIRNLYSKTGFIKDITVEDGVFTGELTGVTISGDLIKANTLVADALIIQGTDGLYYRLNADVDNVTEAQLASEEYQTKLHGSNIIAKTITADRISVSDLTAFGATIGGFNITDNSIYSGVKSSVDNTTRGIYMDNNGQFVFGDNTQFIKYYKADNDEYRFIIDTDAISFGDNYLYLAKNSRNATIDMCNGLATMYHASKYSYDSLFVIDTAVVEIKGASTPLCLTAGNTSLENVSIQFANKDGVLGGVGIVGSWLKRYGSNMFDTYTILDSGNFHDVMDGGWVYCTYGDGFTRYSNNQANLQVRKIGKQVYFRGETKPTSDVTPSSETSTVLCTIPEGYRPSYRQNYVMQGSSANRWLMSVYPDGKVCISRYTNDTTMNKTITSGAWLCCYASWAID